MFRLRRAFEHKAPQVANPAADIVTVKLGIVEDLNLRFEQKMHSFEGS